MTAAPQPPTFTPGMIAVCHDGDRIAIWPDESDDARVFTGQRLESGASLARVRVWNVSCFWRRDCVTRIEAPTEQDDALSLYPSRRKQEAGDGG